jgi:hypothetical protein
MPGFLHGADIVDEDGLAVPYGTGSGVLSFSVKMASLFFVI